MKLLASLLLLACMSGAQEPLFPPARLSRIQSGLGHLYNMDYERARQTFQSLAQDFPDDPAGYAYLAMTCWVEELAGTQELSIDRFAASDFFVENPQYRPEISPRTETEFRRLTQEAIEKARRRLEHDPRDRAARFLRGLAYRNLASFEVSLKRSWWAAFRAGAKAVRDHRELLRSDPEFHDARLSTAVYDYVTGSLPWSVKWLAFLLGYRGDRERGKRELELAAQKAPLAGDDARVVLVLIYTRERNYTKALEHLEELHRKYPDNYLVHLDMAGMTLRMGAADRALALYEEILKTHSESRPRYRDLEPARVYTRMAVVLRLRGRLQEAEQWLRRSLDGNTTLRTETVARLELAKTLDRMGRRREALQLYEAVRSAPDVAGSRAEAERLLRSPFRE
ncbi:MAG TPA: tetratricopeptide repeat protein [Bryobacteraceae bacterium]|nr:tetratricopeptide repeat protein [Bryobacteraceae bacterium]